MQYTDADITFYLVVYQDFDRAVWCLQNVRTHYPFARIVIDVDGDNDPRWASLRELFHVDVFYGGRLFVIPCGGQLVLRALRRYVDVPAVSRWLFRIDTDTEVRRRFHELPPFHYFGQYDNWRNFVQGGCIGLSRTICRQVLNSKCLELQELARPIVWQRGHPEIARERLTQGLVSFDWIVNWAMCLLKVQAQDFKEIRSTWQTPIAADVDCAIAHPCKIIPVNRPI